MISYAAQRQIGFVLLLMVATFLIIWGTWELLEARRARRRARARAARAHRRPQYTLDAPKSRGLPHGRI